MPVSKRTHSTDRGGGDDGGRGSARAPTRPAQMSGGGKEVGYAEDAAGAKIFDVNSPMMTMSNKRRNNTWKNGVIVVFFVAIIIFVIVVVAKNSHKAAGSGGAKGVIDITTDHGMILDKVSLNEVCVDKKSCQENCGHYHECCGMLFDESYEISPDGGTCYNTNVEKCYSYAKCHMIHSEIEPAPDNIDQICSKAVIGINRNLCAEVCEKVKCCWDYQNNYDNEDYIFESCLDDNYGVCQDYSYCQNLRNENEETGTNTDFILHVAPKHLDVECENGSSLCMRECSIASNCCSQPNSICYRDNFIACLSYMACNTLKTPKYNFALKNFRAALPPPPENIKAMCSHTHEDVEPCKNACTNATCCWYNGKDGAPCFGADPLSCFNYQACEILVPPRTAHLQDTMQARASDRFPKSRKYMDNVCDPVMVFAFPENCQQNCPVIESCCDPFHDGNSTCFASEMSGCYSYAKCHSLTSKEDPNYVRPAIIPLETNCAPSAIFKDKASCVALCEAARCCWDDSVDSCLSTKFDVCLDYAYCQNLRAAKLDRDIISVAPSSLDHACFSGSPECKGYCELTLDCCTNPFSACYRNNFIACLSYATCPSHTDADVVAPINGVLPQPRKEIHEKCSKDFVATHGVGTCSNLCDAGKCCFAVGEANCFGADPLACIEYEQCRILYNGDTPVFTVDRNSVTSVCTNELVREGSREDKRACEGICEPFKNGCCDPYDVVNDDGGSCFHENMPECLAYARCHVLNGITPAPEGNLIEICGFDRISSSDKKRKECEEICEPVKCCWDDTHSEPCYYNRFESCLDYGPCQNLRIVDDTRIIVSNIKNETTAESTAVAPITLKVSDLDIDKLCREHDESCYSICASAGRCCNHKYSDCYRENFLTCLTYATCKHYFGVNLHVPMVHNFLPPNNPGNDYTVCAESYITTYGDAECKIACKPSDCCWVSGTQNEGNCFGTDPLGCMQYLQCRVLWKNSTAISSP